MNSGDCRALQSLYRENKNSEKEREKRCVFSLDLTVDSVVDDVTSGGREFHIRDAAAGKARSP